MKKTLIFLFLILALTFLIIGGTGIVVYLYQQNLYKNPLFLQEQYATALEKKLIYLLEPSVGIGNIRASVQAEMTEQNMHQTQTKPPYLKMRKTKETGPLLVNQSVSVLINEKVAPKLSIYEKLIRSAVGYTPERGDMLTVEALPFIKEPFWLLGLSPIILGRIAALLFLFVIFGVFWLIHEWIHCRPQSALSSKAPNKDLWQKIQDLPVDQLVSILKIKRPEITAFILYHLSQKKAATIIDLLPSDYMNKVIVHLNHIEQLDFNDRNELLLSTENDLKDIIKAVQENFQFMQDSSFEKLRKWSDSDLQELLHFVSKHDLILALQKTSLAVQQTFARNIPPSLWQDIIYKTQLNPCSKEDSQKAQNKILKMAQLLKEKN